MLKQRQAGMRSLIAALLTFRALTLNAQAPDTAALAVFDSAVSIMRAHALVRDTVSWDVVIPEYRTRLASAAKREDAYPVVAMLARRLGDRHSFFRPPMIVTPPAQQGATTPPRPETPVETRWIADARVGYLKVPSHGGSNMDASRVYVAAARAAIAAMVDSGACAWVVDLRGNGGGNMWPMLSGLRPLLGDDELGAFKASTATTRWGVNTYARGYDAGLPTPPDLTTAPVAVLTDARTLSSGEATYTAFRGRPNTRSFGSPTGGLSTANRGFPLPGGGTVVLTVSVYVDRLGNEYGAKMPVDEDVPMAETDAPLARALTWLSEQGACRAR
jgi:carboxyl-terminal processing protease